MLESYIEGQLRKEAKKRGGMALKCVSPGMNGVPEEEMTHAEKFTDQIQHQTVHAVPRF